MRNKCRICEAIVDEGHKSCPLCKVEIKGNSGNKTRYSYEQPKIDLTQTNFKYYNILKILAIVAFVSSICLTFVFYKTDTYTTLIWIGLSATSFTLALYLLDRYKDSVACKIVLCSSLLVCLLTLLLDMNDGKLTWAIVIVLPSTIVVANFLHLSCVLILDNATTSTVFFTFVFLVAGIVVHLLSVFHVFVFSTSENQTLNITYLCIELFFLIFVSLFKYKEFKSSLHAKLHL